MSRYFATLNRLRSGQQSESTESGSVSKTEEARPALLPSRDVRDERARLFPELPLATRQHSWNHLLDVLRSQNQQGFRPTIVLAGVSGKERVDPIVVGLEQQSVTSGTRLRVVDVIASGGRRLLKLRSNPSTSVTPTPNKWSNKHTSLEASTTFELSGMTDSRQLSQWLENTREGTDLLIIRGLGIVNSSDSLLLARACDGLAMVVEPMITTRQALEQAAEKAKSSGCRVIGLVISGKRDWLPSWLMRLVEAF